VGTGDAKERPPFLRETRQGASRDSLGESGVCAGLLELAHADLIQ